MAEKKSQDFGMQCANCDGGFDEMPHNPPCPLAKAGLDTDDWRLVKAGEVAPLKGGHGSWVETDHPAVVACMGSAPTCAANGCQLEAADARVQALEHLVSDLQAHAREHGWQDVDEPIAALLAWKPHRAEPRREAVKVCASCGVPALHPDDECCRECYGTRWMVEPRREEERE